MMLSTEINRFIQKEISFKKLELFLLKLPLKQRFKSGIGLRDFREAIIVKWTDQDDCIGYGESSCRPDPYYSHEFASAAFDMIEGFIAPELASLKRYNDLLSLMKKIRGWEFTKSAVEFALNDCIRKKSGCGILESFEAERVEKIPVGISLGIMNDRNIFEKTVLDAVKSGYRRLKFKISPQTKLENFEWLKKQQFSQHISFDANGSYSLNDLESLEFFSSFNVEIEQPFPPNRVDFFLKAIQEIPQLRTCLDEDIHNLGQLIAMQKLNAIDELNIKPGRVGGLVNSLEMIQYCSQQKLPAWIGGMFETGVGRSQNIQVASFLPHAKAHDLSPSHRYFKEDILEEAIQMSSDGYTSLKESQDAKVNEEKLAALSREHREWT